MSFLKADLLVWISKTIPFHFSFCSYYNTKSVLLCLGITALVCLSVTLFSFQTKVSECVLAGLGILNFVTPFTGEGEVGRVILAIFRWVGAKRGKNKLQLPLVVQSQEQQLSFPTSDVFLE